MNLKRLIVGIVSVLCLISTTDAFEYNGLSFSARYKNGLAVSVYITAIKQSAGTHVVIPEKMSWWDSDEKESNQNIPVTEIKLSAASETVKVLEAPYVKEIYLNGRTPALEKLVVSGELEKLGGLSKKDVPNLKSVSVHNGAEGLPQSLKVIEVDCFNGQTDLFKGAVNLPNLTGIGARAFCGCTSLKEIDLSPSPGLTEIMKEAFMGSGIVYIKLPKSLKKIRAQAFLNCMNLCNSSNVTGLQLPETVEDVEQGAFAGCINLGWIGMKGVVRCSDDLTIKEYLGVFEGCTSLKWVTLSNNFSDIRPRMFKDCTSLERLLRPGQKYGINFPQNITSIREYAFENCVSLKNPKKSKRDNDYKDIYIPAMIDYVDQYAFKGCTGLVSVAFPYPNKEGLVVYKNSFEGCTTLKNVTVYDPQTSEPAMLSRASVYNGKLRFMEDAFIGCTALESMPPAYVFESRYDMSKHAISAVQTPLYLEEVTSQTLLRCSPFFNASENDKITTVYFSKNTTNIGKDVLSGYPNVDRIVLMSDFKYMDEDFSAEFPDYPLDETADEDYNEVFLQVQECAFSGAGKLMTIECNHMTPPAIPDNAFSAETYLNGKLVVPEDSEYEYRAAAGWRNFNIINDRDKASSADIISDMDADKAVYYDLYGRKVDRPGCGVYIVRRGTQTYKTVLR